MTKPTQHTIESEDASITKAVGGPWPVDPSITQWTADDGTVLRFQFREFGAVLEKGGESICWRDARSPAGPDPPSPTGLQDGLDVSSHQPRDLTAIINSLDPRPQHAIIRLYQDEYEGPSPDHSIAQIESARANGLSCSGYCWIYRDIDGGDSVRSALKTADRAGLVLPMLYLDVEPYLGTCPTVANVQRAVDVCLERSVPVSIYTGAWVWTGYMNDTTAFSHLPLWNASYGQKPATLEPVHYGGWSVPVAVQWTDTPVDRNVIDAAVTVPPTGSAPPPYNIGRHIVTAASYYEGVPYGMPPGPSELDCSSYVLEVFKDVEHPFAAGVRTAEQERQACTLIPWDQVAPGDLLFFENTYTPSEGLGPDGHVASHVGISLGAGTQRMWNALDPAVALTDISTPYWQEHLLTAGRPRHL